MADYAKIVFRGETYHTEKILIHAYDSPVITVEPSKLDNNEELKVFYTAGAVPMVDRPVVMEYNNKYVVLVGERLVKDSPFEAYLLSRPRLKKARQQ